MAEQSDIGSFIMDNIQKFFFPEEWIALDRSLSKVELLVLYFISRNGDITMTRLAEGMGFALSTTTGIVDRLVKRGYVNRNRAESDRRIVLITLSEKGMGIIHSFQTTLGVYLAQVENILSEEERGQLLHIIMKILRLFQQEKTTERPPQEKVALRRIDIE